MDTLRIKLMDCVNNVENMRLLLNQNNFSKPVFRKFYISMTEFLPLLEKYNINYYTKLKGNMEKLTVNNNSINPFSFGAIINILFLLNEELDNIDNNFWLFMHPKLQQLCCKKFSDGHFSDSVETALKEICSIIRSYRKSLDLEEILSDKNMLRNTFKVDGGVLKFTNCADISEENIHNGYCDIFSGTMQAMRNIVTHANVEMEKPEAARKLMLASDLMYMLDKAFVIGNVSTP